MAARTEQVPNIMRQRPFVPWLYLAPALIVMTLYIVYPGLDTIYQSLRNAQDTGWASTTCVAGQPCWGIFENYRYALTSSDMLTSIFNNVKWILLMVTGTVLFGLLVATLADRVRYESVAKSIVFLPMAISFVGAGVIWKFVYDYQASGTQIGIVNAIITGLGFEPVSFLTTPQINTLALIVVGVWMWTGFCMTILSAALKSVPTEIIEAARVDGATEWRVFTQITVPIIMPTIAVVITTMIINVLKIFDIVYVMTGGQYGTQVIALSMYNQMYVSQNAGRATAIAVILILVIIPAMIYNIRRFQAQEAMR